MIAYIAGELVLFVAVVALLFEACRKWLEADKLDKGDDGQGRYGHKGDSYRALASGLAIAAGVVTLILIIVGGIHWACS